MITLNQGYYRPHVCYGLTEYSSKVSRFLSDLKIQFFENENYFVS